MRRLFIFPFNQSGPILSRVLTESVSSNHHYKENCPHPTPHLFVALTGFLPMAQYLSLKMLILERTISGCKMLNSSLTENWKKSHSDRLLFPWASLENCFLSLLQAAVVVVKDLPASMKNASHRPYKILACKAVWDQRCSPLLPINAH